MTVKPVMERPLQLNKDDSGNYECYGCNRNMIKGFSTFGFEFLRCPDRCRDNRHNWTLEGGVFDEKFIAQFRAEYEAARRAKYGGYLSYFEYIVSPEWRTRSIAVCTSRGSKCEICGSKKKIQVHHRSYDRMGHELEEDLEVICKSCHDLLHWAVDQYPDKYTIDSASSLLRLHRDELVVEKTSFENKPEKKVRSKKASEEWKQVPATTGQMYTLKKLGYKGMDNISKFDAWNMIELMETSK